MPILNDEYWQEQARLGYPGMSGVGDPNITGEQYQAGQQALGNYMQANSGWRNTSRGLFGTPAGWLMGAMVPGLGYAAGAAAAGGYGTAGLLGGIAGSSLASTGLAQASGTNVFGNGGGGGFDLGPYSGGVIYENPTTGQPQNPTTGTPSTGTPPTGTPGEGGGTNVPQNPNQPFPYFPGIPGIPYPGNGGGGVPGGGGDGPLDSPDPPMDGPNYPDQVPGYPPIIGSPWGYGNGNGYGGPTPGDLAGSPQAGMGGNYTPPAASGDVITTQNTTAPWGPLQPYIATSEYGYVPQAGALYASGAPMTSGMNELEIAGLQGQMEGANFAGGFLTPQAYAAQSFGLGTGMLPEYQQAMREGLQAADVANNPYIQGAIQSQTDLLNRNLAENILPEIGRQSTGVGQYGSSRQGVAEGIAARGTQEAIGQNAANMLLGGYNTGVGARGQALGQGLQQQGRALALAPQTMGLSQFPGQVTQDVGQTYRADVDRALMEPYRQLEFYGNQVGRAQGVGSQSSVQQPYDEPSSGMNMLGGALLGGQLGGYLFPNSQWGGLGGAAAGAILGGFF